MNFRSISLLNILGQKNKNIALFIFSFLLSLSIFLSSLVLLSLRNGLKNLELRLGSDIIVVPYEARTKVNADTILNSGNRTYFYMNKANLAKVKNIEGVEKVSPQIFLCSMNASCCSTTLNLIGFDPESDFSIRPWLKDNFTKSLLKGDIIIGSNVSLPLNRTLRFFGINCNVVSQLTETGTGLDNAVYTNFETATMLLESAKKNGFSFSKTLKPDKMISQIMVKVSPSYDVDSVASLIGRRVKKTISVKTKTMTSEIANNLLSLEKIILLLSIFICVLCFSLLLVISLLVTGIRKKEFAILRAMGASRKKLLRIVALEQFLLNASASFFAIFFAFLCVFPFRFAIQNLVSLPFLFPNFLTTLTLAIFSFLFSIIISSFSASFSAYKISMIDSASILRET